MNITQILTLINRGVRITLEQRLRDVLAPAHMQGPWSRKWWGTIGAFAELFWQGGQQAADVGFPATCPADALDYVGSNENIERLLDEPDGTYRDRLRDPFPTWEASGTIAGIEAQLADYTGADVSVYDMAAGWVPDDSNTYSFARFWVVISEPPQWSAMTLEEELVLSDDLVLGVSGMTQRQYTNLRRIVHKWRSGHSGPVSFYIDFDGTLAATSTTAVDALIAAGTAVELPITRPWLADDLVLGPSTTLGFYIQPL